MSPAAAATLKPATVVSVTDEPPFGGMTRQMNKMLDQMHKGYFGFAPSETWTPNVNLYENDEAYVVCVDLAGVEKEKIDVVVQDGRLRLRGTRPVPQCPESHDAEGHVQRVRVHVMEIDHGAFSREVELPHDVDKERIAAVYREGMLWIELPKI